MVLGSQSVINATGYRAEGRTMIQESEPNGLVDHQTEVSKQLADLNVPNGNIELDNFQARNRCFNSAQTVVVLQGGE